MKAYGISKKIFKSEIGNLFEGRLLCDSTGKAIQYNSATHSRRLSADEAESLSFVIGRASEITAVEVGPIDLKELPQEYLNTCAAGKTPGGV